MDEKPKEIEVLLDAVKGSIESNKLEFLRIEKTSHIKSDGYGLSTEAYGYKVVLTLSDQ